MAGGNFAQTRENKEPKSPNEIGLTAPNTEFPNAKSAPWIFDHKFISQAI